MKGKLLLKVNVLLGILAAFFAGCHSQAKVVRQRGPVAKYGVPQEILDSMRRQQNEQMRDTLRVEPQEAEEDTVPVPERQPKKYGPMPPR